jgi:hypothetical protein
MTAHHSGHSTAFSGIRGAILGRLLQIDFVRFHRVQLGAVECPGQYSQFLADVVGPRLFALPGRLGIFGVGAHTEVVLKALPTLGDRIHCFTDNNGSVWHQTRFGKPVLPPTEAVATCEAFFLSTAVFQRVLDGDLRRHGFRGPIVAVDDVVPPSWFLSSDDPRQVA